MATKAAKKPSLGDMMKRTPVPDAPPGPRGTKSAKPATTGDWMSDAGWDQAQAVVTRVENQRAAKALMYAGTRRVYCVVGGGYKGIMIDGKPTMIREHTFKPDPTSYDEVHKTCLARNEEDTDNCPFCMARNKFETIGMMSIVHTHAFNPKKMRDYEPVQWVSKKKETAGETVRNPIELMACKPNAIKLLIEYAKRNQGNLAGLPFEAKRMGDKSPRVGDTFFFESKRVNFKDMKFCKSLGHNKLIVPIDYKHELAPVSPQEAQEFLLTVGVQAGAADDGTVPF